MRQSKIEWTESTWNPVNGCTKLSAGCVNCYAERMAKRLQAMGQPNYRNGFKVTYGWVIVGGESGLRSWRAGKRVKYER